MEADPSAQHDHVDQGHTSWSPLTQQLNGEMETHKQVHFINKDKSTSNHIIHLVSEYQQRVISLNRGIERKKQEIQRLKALIADRHAEILSAYHPVTMPAIRLMTTWLEVQDVKTTLTELQAMCEEEAAQKVRLCKQIQHLNHQLELQSEQHSKDLQSMSKRIERSKVLVQQLDERVGRGYDEAALKNVLDNLKETTEFELKMFQGSVAQLYDQNVATLIALQNSDQILLEHEMSENQQLHQCIGLLKEEATALRSKVLSEEAQCQMLAGMIKQERDYDHQCLQALQEQIQGLWQRLGETDGRSAAQTAANPHSETETVTAQLGGAENRLYKELTDLVGKALEEGCSEIPRESHGDRQHPQEQEGDQGMVSSTAHHSEMEMFEPALCPPASVPVQSEKLQDSQITQKLSTEKNWHSSDLTPNRNPAISRATTSVKIQELDSKGCFVQLFNTSYDKNIDLSGCTLQQRVGAYPISLYRFPQHSLLPAQQCLKVWAAVADISQRLPSDLVWQEQHRFRSGPECTTALCKSNGQPIAWYIPLHRFSAAANSFDVKDDASEDWTPVPLNKQQISQAVTPQKQCMQEAAWAPSPSDTRRTSWTDFVPLHRRGSISAYFSSSRTRPQSNTSSLTERSSLGETDINSYLQSSLVSLPSDSLPDLITPDSSGLQSPIQLSRRSSNTEELNLTTVPQGLAEARLLPGLLTQRNTRSKYTLRFMSYPPFTTDMHVSRR
ncbi:prelamin-A/C-like isoform X1 [Chiloscyllium plagiosum]|uniref:prelamin-A/C-like isoform X1 n=2 Tax=Chiloscyllium plagiosum TaxID=36176 RepID=UPI001CB8872A|nr:prelamin-A/C-like isoform X1 [Chiloscyllium plagiosum]